MMARVLAPLRRVMAMDADELAFRLRCDLRNRWDHTRWAVSRPAWSRAALRRVLADARPDESLFLASARSAAVVGDWASAHRALARHVVNRTTPFPLQPTALEALTLSVRAAFPAAERESAARADRILDGRYDLLGYSGLDIGRPPRWHYDPVQGREAPGGFWSAVPYLDPASGDHKVIWEINRHQHWLSLARACHLTGHRRYYDEFVRQLEDWLAANPPLEGVNWASMLELAFRGLSWLWALHLFAPAAVDEQEPALPWTVDLLLGLDRQLAHVERNLSLYFSPNTHLTGEALALYVAGAVLPELRASERRVALGRAVLEREARRQIRGDGGHAELSAHYHRYSTDFYLLALQVARACGDPVEGVFAEAARRQAGYLRGLADDTGQLPLLGDDDGGQLFPMCGRPPADCRDTLAVAAVLLEEPTLAVAPPPEEVYWRCGGAPALASQPVSRSRWPSMQFVESGYCVSRTVDGDHLVFDAGPHGFLNGGHAHADALAIVATVGNLPLLVDPGTATYTMDPVLRNRFRSTAMHNTVVVNGAAQSIPRGPFHWQSATDAARSVARLADGVEYFEARHHGYAPIVHVRAVLALHGLAWFVVDHLLQAAASADDVSAHSFWHFHPEWTVTSAMGPDVRLRHADGATQALATSGRFASVRGTAFEALGAHAPVYGRIERAECLYVATDGRLPRSTLTVVPMLAARANVLAVESLALAEPLGGGWHGAAWRVRLDDIETTVACAVEGDGVPAAESAAPPTRWGTSELQLVGRAALLATTGSDHEAVLVNGRHVAAGPVQMNHDLSQPLIRSGGWPRRAPQPTPDVQTLATARGA